MPRPIAELRELYHRGVPVDMLTAVIEASPSEPLLVIHRHGTLITSAEYVPFLQTCFATQPGGRIQKIFFLKAKRI